MQLTPPNFRPLTPWSQRIASPLCTLVLVMTAGPALAQSMFGQQSTASSGLSAGSTMSSSSSGFGGSTGSGFGSAAGSTGQTLGAGGFGSSSSSTAGRTGTSGGSQPNAQFGQQQSQQRGFVGVDSGDSLGSLFGAAGQGNARGQQNTNLRAGNDQRRFQANQPQATKVPIRTHLNIRFPRTSLAPELVSTKLQSSLNPRQRPAATGGQRRTPVSSRAGLASVTPQVEGRTVTLRGTVPNEDAKRLAVRMAKLEPGISRVVDELTIAP